MDASLGNVHVKSLSPNGVVVLMSDKAAANSRPARVFALKGAVKPAAKAATPRLAKAPAAAKVAASPRAASPRPAKSKQTAVGTAKLKPGGTKATSKPTVVAVKETKLSDEAAAHALARHDLASASGELVLLCDCGGARLELSDEQESSFPKDHRAFIVKAAASGTPLGQVQPAPSTDARLSPRVSLTPCWRVASELGLDAVGALQVQIELDTGPLVIRLRPALAYGCAAGSRLKILGSSQRCGTVVRLLRDGRVVVRIDNNGGETACDARPGIVVSAPPTRYENQERLVVVHRGSCIDATVVEWGGADTGSRHTIRLLSEGGAPAGGGAEATVELDLNEFNHCRQRFDSVAAMEAVRLEYCRKVYCRVTSIVEWVAQVASHADRIRLTCNRPVTIVTGVAWIKFY